MKLTIIGIIFMMTSVAIAGNWLYSPFALHSPLVIQELFEPIPHYPEGDTADDVFHSELTYIPVEDIYYQEWNYVWLDASGHTPDTEEIRIYVKNGKIHHISLRIHYQWMEITDFEEDENHVHIYFALIYHTPYISNSSLISTLIQRALPVVLPMLLGIGLIIYDNREKLHLFKKEKK